MIKTAFELHAVPNHHSCMHLAQHFGSLPAIPDDTAASSVCSQFLFMGCPAAQVTRRERIAAAGLAAFGALQLTLSGGPVHVFCYLSQVMCCAYNTRIRPAPLTQLQVPCLATAQAVLAS